jgi:hypothetical protein
MGLELPEGMELMQDVSASAWVTEALWPWGWSPPDGEGATRVGSFLPAVFDAYARILNPAGENRTTPWRDIAAGNGVELGPESTFADICGIGLHGARALDQAAPRNGCLPPEETRALSRLLEPYTATPERCWFCLWVGWGFWWHGAHSILVSSTRGSRAQRAELAEYERQSKEVDAIMRRAPQVRTRNREYFLFRGPVRLADTFPPIGGPWYQSPNIWWPDDRAWCAITEVDGYSSFVGGSCGCIDAVLSSSELETIEASPEHRIGDDALN